MEEARTRRGSQKQPELSIQTVRVSKDSLNSYMLHKEKYLFGPGFHGLDRVM